MLAQSIRASRQTLARVARQPLVARRTFIVPTAARQDYVQDLYLKELKNYKAPAVKASDAEGHVQKFSIPKPPPSPEESDIANDLKAYDSQTVELEGVSTGAEEGGAVAIEEDWFEEEADETPTAAH